MFKQMARRLGPNLDAIMPAPILENGKINYSRQRNSNQSYIFVILMIFSVSGHTELMNSTISSKLQIVSILKLI